MATLTTDAITAANAQGTGPMSWSHTIGTGPRTGLAVISCACDEGAPPTMSCTYNGVSMTQLVHWNPGSQRAYIWWLFAPAVGAHNVSISWSGSAALGATAVSFFNAPQTDPIKSYTTGGPNSVVVSGLQSGDLVIDASGGYDGDGVQNLAAGAGQTQHYAWMPGLVGLGGSRETSTGSSVTMSWTNTSSTSMYIIAAAFKPFRVKPKAIILD